MFSHDKVPYDIPQPNNMGVVRYALALGVLIAHFNEFGGGNIWWPISSYNAVGGFFALSGFLMIGSWLRHPDLKSYIQSRARRILPAYWSVVLFFAIALYPFSTADDYFTSSGFWKYLGSNLSFLNFLHPDLPGVFSTLKMSAVNGSLWTMKVEWFLYLSLPFVAWFLVRYRRHPGLILSAVYFLSVIYRLAFYYLYLHTGKEIYEILSRQFLGQMMFFYTGVFVYYYFRLFIRHRYLILSACLILTCFGYPYMWMRFMIEPAVISALVIWFSMVGRWGVWFGRHDNISYNIYLIHFPIVQLSAMYAATDHLGSAAAFAIVLGVTVILSFLLNRFVERRFSHLRRR